MEIKWTALTNKNNEPLTAVWQKWRFSAPQTHLWLIKHWFSASTFVVKIATFAKPPHVSGHAVAIEEILINLHTIDKPVKSTV